MSLLNFNMLAVVLEEVKQRSLSGCLNATRNNITAQIFFEHGKIRHTQTIPLEHEGEEALYRLLSWQNGQLKWEDASPPILYTIDRQQADNFQEAVAILQQRGNFLDAINHKVDPAFFSPVKAQPSAEELDSAFWYGVISRRYCPYKDLVATTANFNGLLKAFETSKRTGIIKVSHNGLEVFYLVKGGYSLGAFRYNEANSEFKLVNGPLLPLFDLPESRLVVFLVPQTGVLAPTSPHIEPSPVPASPTHLSYDINNPYDF